MMSASRRACAVLAAAALVWCLLILLPPALMSLRQPEAAVLLRRLFAPVCHQEAARSFLIAGHPLAVCHRCTAVYLAFAAVAVGFSLLSLPGLLREMSLPRLALFLLPMAVDAGFDLLGWWSNSALSRSVSGGCAGAGLACFVIPAWIEAWKEFFPLHAHITLSRKVHDG